MYFVIYIYETYDDWFLSRIVYRQTVRRLPIFQYIGKRKENYYYVKYFWKYFGKPNHKYLYYF